MDEQYEVEILNLNNLKTWSNLTINIISLFLLSFFVSLLVMNVVIEGNHSLLYSSIPFICYCYICLVAIGVTYKRSRGGLTMFLLCDLLIDYLSGFLVSCLLVVSIYTELNLLVVGIPYYISTVISVCTITDGTIYVGSVLSTLKFPIRLTRALTYLLFTLRYFDYVKWGWSNTLLPLLFIGIVFFILGVVLLTYIYKTARSPEYSSASKYLWLTIMSLYISSVSLTMYISLIHTLETNNFQVLKYSSYPLMMITLITLLVTWFSKAAVV